MTLWADSRLRIDDDPEEFRESPPFGIYGAGVTFLNEHPQPAIFVVPELFDGSSVHDEVSGKDIQSTAVASHVESLGIEIPPQTLVVALPRPLEQTTTGDAIVCGSMNGTAGVAAKWQQQPCMLTAGHVANPYGANVMASGASVGAVMFADWLGNNHGPQDIVADVSVVVLAPGVGLNQGPAVTARSSVKQYDDVTAYGARSGPQSGWVRYGLLPNFALSKSKGRWGEVSLTDRAISVGGDSGAPVLLTGTSTIVGHIVAGAGNAYSIIQDIGYIASSARLTLP